MLYELLGGRRHSTWAGNQEVRGGRVTQSFLLCYRDILPKRNSFTSGKTAVSEDDFNKCISPVAGPLHRFDSKPFQTLCLRTWGSGPDVLAGPPTGSRTGLVGRRWPRPCSLLSKEGHRQWDDDAIVLVNGPLLDPR